MLKKHKVKVIFFSILVCVFLLVFYQGFTETYYVKYYKTLKWEDGKDKPIFLNPIDSVEMTKGIWYWKVYYNSNKEIVKLENYKDNGELFGVITDIKRLYKD